MPSEERQSFSGASRSGTRARRETFTFFLVGPARSPRDLQGGPPAARSAGEEYVREAIANVVKEAIGSEASVGERVSDG